jgi:hypothetical protein
VPMQCLAVGAESLDHLACALVSVTVAFKDLWHLQIGLLNLHFWL